MVLSRLSYLFAVWQWKILDKCTRILKEMLFTSPVQMFRITQNNSGGKRIPHRNSDRFLASLNLIKLQMGWKSAYLGRKQTKAMIYV